MLWETIIREESQQDYYRAIQAPLALAVDVCPPLAKRYRALDLTPFDQVKVVILGQDPYHGGQANGLAFAVDEKAAIPPSLLNIFKEIEIEYGARPASRSLENWAAQGVLLLNTVLTVEKHHALSHKDLGWQTFTDRIIRELGQDSKPRVFLLWGSQARAKKDLIHARHLVLESVHPSPLSAYRGFFGCGHFKLANDFLTQQKFSPIDWLNS